MRSRLGKPTIREERAETGATAWIKLARPPDCQKQSLRNPRTGVFEEEGFTFN